MTQEIYKKASMIEAQIEHIDTLLHEFGSKVYPLDIPTRRTPFRLVNMEGESLALNEADVELFKTTLRVRKELLIKEFEHL